MPNPGDHRCTPKSVIDVVRAFREIGCDPCWNPGAVFRPRVVYDGNGLGSGLEQPWATTCGECVWVNGPWSNLVPWADKSVREFMQGAEVLFWGAVYPETAWSKRLYSRASAVCLWGKRVHHPFPPDIEAEINAKRAAEGKPPMGKGSQWPNQLIYLGEDVARFREHFSQHGTVMFPIGAVA